VVPKEGSVAGIPVEGSSVDDEAAADSSGNDDAQHI
jgi:hypothetical protein